jgi:hypothetical protein
MTLMHTFNDGDSLSPPRNCRHACSQSLDMVACVSDGGIQVNAHSQIDYKPLFFLGGSHPTSSKCMLYTHP